MIKLIYAHDGVSLYDELFISSLREKYDIHVLTFHPTPRHIPQGIEITTMPDLVPATNLHPFEGARKHILTPIRALTFKKYASGVKPDALIGCWATTYGFYAAYSNLHPFVLFVWGSDVLVFPWKFVPLRTLVRYALRKADVVVVDSDVQKKAVVRLGCESDKILRFPWVKLNGFESNVKQKFEGRKELGWTEDDIVVIGMRDHNPVYGVNYLIEAIPFILEQESKAKFLILGEGELTSQFKQRVRKQIAQGSVRFLGKAPHEDVAKYLNAADIYVSTSFSDGTSASLLEAMACSTTPIVTAISGNKEWIQDGWNGYLTPTRDVNQLAQKIVFLAKNEEVRRKMAKNAFETVRTKVNWQRNIATLNDTIRDVISQKS